MGTRTTRGGRTLLSVGAISLASVSHAEPPAYTVTDITGWSDAQLAALPHFDHAVPVKPAGALPAFVGAACNDGATVGTTDGYYGDYAAFVTDAGQTTVPPIGVYYWERTWWDGEDLHFQNGRVGFSSLHDVNRGGVMVGESTLNATGDSGTGYTAHAVLLMPGQTDWVDITPDAVRASATGIADNGQIAGWVFDGIGATRAFRRSNAGVITLIDTLGGGSNDAITINNTGVVVGLSSVLGSTIRQPFASTGGAQSVALPLPSQGSPDAARPEDLSNTHLIVGSSWGASTPWEPLATLWFPNASVSAWTAYDLNELLDSNPIDAILDRAEAVNDQGYILVRGHEDGTDLFLTRLYLLTPDVPIALPPNPADFNADGNVNDQDFFDFINDFFGPTPSDFNADGNVNDQDFFDFVNAFFA